MSDLLFSHKPEVLRLHEIEEQERTKFCSDFNMTLSELLPPSTLRNIRSSKLLSRLMALSPDAYYTLVTTLKCRRRLGEEYTYIAMYKGQHYEQQGVLLNKKTRGLLAVLQLLSRHLLVPSFIDLMDKPTEQNPKKNAIFEVFESLRRWVLKYLGAGQTILANLEWFVLMLFMLDWSKRFTIIQKLLGISYVYTYKSDELKDVSYKLEGYLILVTLLVKGLRHAYAIYSSRQKEKEKMKNNIGQPVTQALSREGQGVKESKKPEGVLCRICYDEMNSRSATKCGHIFCWSCIIRTLEMSQECPVCRAKCHPREVVQLRNY